MFLSYVFHVAYTFKFINGSLQSSFSGRPRSVGMKVLIFWKLLKKLPIPENVKSENLQQMWKLLLATKGFPPSFKKLSNWINWTLLGYIFPRVEHLSMLFACQRLFLTVYFSNDTSPLKFFVTFTNGNFVMVNYQQNFWRFYDPYYLLKKWNLFFDDQK